MTRTFCHQGSATGWLVRICPCADVSSSSRRRVAADNPRAVVTVCGSCGADSVGTTHVGARYAKNWHPSFCRAGCAISYGGCRSARIGDSAVGRFLSLALLAVVGLGGLLLSKQLFNRWLQ